MAIKDTNDGIMRLANRFLILHFSVSFSPLCVGAIDSIGSHDYHIRLPNWIKQKYPVFEPLDTTPFAIADTIFTYAQKTKLNL